MKVLMTLVLVFVLAGCAAGEGDGAGSTTTQEEITVYKEETTVLQGGGDLRRPPESTLSYGGREVKGMLGSYCWTSHSSGICADAPPITPPRKKMLTVPSGSEMEFRYGRQRSPDTVNAGAVPLDKQGMSTASANPNRSPKVIRSRSLKAHGSGVERTIPVELPQGEYVVDVFLKEQQGDASYFFRIMVE